MFVFVLCLYLIHSFKPSSASVNQFSSLTNPIISPILFAIQFNHLSIYYIVLTAYYTKTLLILSEKTCPTFKEVGKTMVWHQSKTFSELFPPLHATTVANLVKGVSITSGFSPGTIMLSYLNYCIYQMLTANHFNHLCITWASRVDIDICFLAYYFSLTYHCNTGVTTKSICGYVCFFLNQIMISVP